MKRNHDCAAPWLGLHRKATVVSRLAVSMTESLSWRGQSLRCSCFLSLAAFPFQSRRTNPFPDKVVARLLGSVPGAG